MSYSSGETPSSPVMGQADFERISSMVSREFRIESAFLEHGVPTYLLEKKQKTKEQFLNLLHALESMKLTPVLRKTGDKIILRVIPKPEAKPSNVLVNWVLFFATVATTGYTGFVLTQEFAAEGAAIEPLLAVPAFVLAIMGILGAHEMGHKLMANRNKMEATSPYFIPGPPPNIGGFGTFGAVIMQKSLPPNRDALFDIGSSGPIIGFVIATIVAVIGFPLSHYVLIPESQSTLPAPVLFLIIGSLLTPGGAVPVPQAGQVLAIAPHPVLFAGWVGMIVTMLNLLPVGMLDGGHVARALAGDGLRWVLTGLSIVFLFLQGFIPMAVLVLFFSLYRHPGPLDDVSSLSTSRKIMVAFLIAVFALSVLPSFSL